MNHFEKRKEKKVEIFSRVQAENGDWRNEKGWVRMRERPRRVRERVRDHRERK